MRCCIKLRWIYCIDYRRSCWGPCVSAYCGYTWSSWNCDTGCISLCNCIGLACIKSCVSYRAACSSYADLLYCVCRTWCHSSVEVVIIGSTAQYYIVVCRRCCRCTIETLCYFDCSCGCSSWIVVRNSYTCDRTGIDRYIFWSLPTAIYLCCNCICSLCLLNSVCSSRKITNSTYISTILILPVGGVQGREINCLNSSISILIDYRELNITSKFTKLSTNQSLGDLQRSGIVLICVGECRSRSICTNSYGSYCSVSRSRRCCSTCVCVIRAVFCLGNSVLCTGDNTLSQSVRIIISITVLCPWGGSRESNIILNNDSVGIGHFERNCTKTINIGIIYRLSNYDLTLYFLQICHSDAHGIIDILIIVVTEAIQIYTVTLCFSVKADICSLKIIIRCTWLTKGIICLRKILDLYSLITGRDRKGICRSSICGWCSVVIFDCYTAEINRITGNIQTGNSYGSTININTVTIDLPEINILIESFNRLGYIIQYNRFFLIIRIYLYSAILRCNLAILYGKCNRRSQIIRIRACHLCQCISTIRQFLEFDLTRTCNELKIFVITKICWFSTWDITVIKSNRCYTVRINTGQFNSNIFNLNWIIRWISLDKLYIVLRIFIFDFNWVGRYINISNTIGNWHSITAYRKTQFGSACITVRASQFFQEIWSVRKIRESRLFCSCREYKRITGTLNCSTCSETNIIICKADAITGRICSGKLKFRAIKCDSIGLICFYKINISRRNCIFHNHFACSSCWGSDRWSCNSTITDGKYNISRNQITIRSNVFTKRICTIRKILDNRWSRTGDKC